MGKSSKAPPPPDYTSVAAASEKSSQLAFQLGQEQLAWAKQQDVADRAIMSRVLQTQLPAMEEQAAAAQLDRQRYEQIYQPIEEKLAREAASYDTPEERNLSAGEAVADVTEAFDSLKANARRELESFGIDPSQTRYAAMDRSLDVQKGAAQAGAANTARRNVENVGRALQGEAINIGRGYPGQVAGAYGQAVQAGQAAQQSALNTTASAVNSRNSAIPWFQTGNQALQNWGNTINAGYQNQMQAYNAKASQKSGFMSGLGTLAGAALGGGFGDQLALKLFSADDGGYVPPGSGGNIAPLPGTTDNVPAALTEGEYVVPAHVVRAKGTDFFDKMLEKYSDRSAIPVG